MFSLLQVLHPNSYQPNYLQWHFFSSTRILNDENSNIRTNKSLFVSTKETQTPLLDQIKRTISLKGPITVAEYMQMLLTNEQHGYYMHQDVFGAGGDFITSPEISQLFGELVGVWFVNEWLTNHDGEEYVNVVELGPGRGTLMKDMIRVFGNFASLRGRVCLHLVEVSPHLRRMQAKCLLKAGDEFERFMREQEGCKSGQDLHLCSYKTAEGLKVTWHESLHTLPSPHTLPSSPHTLPPSPQSHPPSSLNASSSDSSLINSSPNHLPPPASTPPTFKLSPFFFIAHEFFDALPIHKFQRVGGRWREVLVDVVAGRLQMVTARFDTVAKALLSDTLNSLPPNQSHVEISPSSLHTVHQLASCIRACGGCALILDYGHVGEKGDTFRAFRKHHVTDPLEFPGECDVTADVNFLFLKKQAEQLVKVHGPVSQRDFLAKMGIDVRLKVLLGQAETGAKAKEDLVTGYQMIMRQEGMGGRFKCMALTSVGGDAGNDAGGGVDNDVGGDGNDGNKKASKPGAVPAGFEQ